MYIERTDKPTEIYGRKLGFGNFHASDVTRYRQLRKYGGIYLDNDMFVVCQSLNVFFKYEFTLDWDESQSLGSQVSIANRNARFLRFALRTYRAYDPKKWY